jgi:hypothetical protein
MAEQEPVRQRRIPITKEELKLLMHLRNRQRRMVCGEVVVQVVIKNGCFKCKEIQTVDN